MFTANSAVQTYNYNFDSIIQDPLAPRAENFQGGSASGEPVDGWTDGQKNGTPLTKASYQDELTLGVEKALDPTLSIGLKGTYRTLGRTVEDRCDLDGGSPLNPSGSTCALFNPGGDGQAASGQFPTCNGSGAPEAVDPTAHQCFDTGVPVGDAKRIFRGIEMVARKQFTNQLWAQASFLYSSLKGNYSGAIREATGQTDPGINADYDYYQFTFNDYGNLELDRPVQARIDAVWNAPFGFSAGAGFYVRSGLPQSRLGWFNDFYPANLYLDQRGVDTRLISGDRTPTDYDLNLSLAYNMNLGPVTVTPQVYLFNVLNRQTATAYDTQWNLNGSFAAVDDPTSPFFGQAGAGSGRGDLPGGRRSGLPGQSGLRQDRGAHRPASAPRGAQGHVLRPIIGLFSGAASAAPFLCRLSQTLHRPEPRSNRTAAALRTTSPGKPLSSVLPTTWALAHFEDRRLLSSSLRQGRAFRSPVFEGGKE